MHGKFPAILKDQKIGKEATALYDDAQKLLKKIIDEKWLFANGVVGFWEAGKPRLTQLPFIKTEQKSRSLNFCASRLRKLKARLIYHWQIL